jgi:hypothetical protein
MMIALSVQKHDIGKKTVEVQNSVRSGLRISLTHFPYSDGQNSAAGFATIRTRVPCLR